MTNRITVKRMVAVLMLVLTLGMVTVMTIPTADAANESANICPVSAETVEVFRTEIYLEANSGTYLYSGKMFGTKLYKIDENGTLLRLVFAQPEKNIFGVKYYRVLVGNDECFVKAKEVKKANSIEKALVLQANGKIDIKRDAKAGSKTLVSYKKGSIILTRGMLYNVKEKVRYYVVLNTSRDADVLSYVNVKNLTAAIDTKNDIYLPSVVEVIQERRDNCGGAALSCVCGFYRRYVNDVTAWRRAGQGKINIGKITDVINEELGDGTYKYLIISNIKTFEAEIRASLGKGRVVLARVDVPKAFKKEGAFTYSTGGHFTTVTAVYKVGGKTYVTITDSYNSKQGGGNAKIEVEINDFYKYFCRAYNRNHDGKYACSAWIIVGA